MRAAEGERTELKPEGGAGLAGGRRHLRGRRTRLKLARRRRSHLAQRARVRLLVGEPFAFVDALCGAGGTAARPVDHGHTRAFAGSERQAVQQLPKRDAVREPRLLEREQRAGGEALETGGGGESR